MGSTRTCHLIGCRITLNDDFFSYDWLFRHLHLLFADRNTCDLFSLAYRSIGWYRSIHRATLDIYLFAVHWHIDRLLFGNNILANIDLTSLNTLLSCLQLFLA